MQKKKVVEKQVTAADRTKLRFLSYIRSKKWFQEMEKEAGLRSEPDKPNLEYSRSDLMQINFDPNFNVDAWDYLADLDHDFKKIIAEERDVTKRIAAKFWQLRESRKKYLLCGLRGQKASKSVENKRLKADYKNLKEEKKELKECLKEIKHLNNILKPYAKQIEAKRRAEEAFRSFGPTKSSLETVPKDFFEVLREIEEKKDQPISRFSQIEEKIPSSDDSTSDSSFLDPPVFIFEVSHSDEVTFKSDNEAPDSMVWNDDYLSDYIIDVYNKCL
ncbi:unnamed protein product [Bursaphelenchus xylophilus]|uniref:(pine wood nematode) hypothetical protein n=1 Tax=Bursaphelenchus xylophilus TaxID=6326 RepID=A0A7I8XQ28_BURXY|nr:unnamed protein product [Bursaphelenchus xylophilus]CAG9087115.1 unnamed protein product [Bursaphelenchus xylophilus]